jgi:putative transposase
MKATPLYKVPVGARLVLDDVSWTVIGADKDGYAVEGLFDGEVTNFGTDWVQNAIAQNRCEVIKPAQLQKTKELLKFTGGYEREEQLPKEERVNIRARLALVAAAEKIESEGHNITQRFLSRPDIITRLERLACEIAQEPNLFRISQVGSTRTPYDIPKGRTLSEMIARFKYFDRNPVALMHRHHLKGPPEHLRSRLCRWQEKFIDFVLNSAMKFSKPKLKPLFDLAKGSFEVPEDAFIRGFEFPSIVTVRTRWAAISKLVKTIGQNGSKFAANAQGAGSTDVRALFYGERGAMDHSLSFDLHQWQRRYCR